MHTHMDGRTHGWTDAGYFLVLLSGFIKTGGDNEGCMLMVKVKVVLFVAGRTHVQPDPVSA